MEKIQKVLKVIANGIGKYVVTFILCYIPLWTLSTLLATTIPGMAIFAITMVVMSICGFLLYAFYY